MTRDDGPPTRTGTDSSDRDTGTDRFRALPFLRRDFLSDSAKLGAGAVALSATGGAAAQADGQTDDGQTEGGQVDQPEGASIEVLAPHAGFTDDVGMALGVSFEQGDDEAAFLHDASTLLLARVALEPGGTTGWHTHPGPVIVTLLEGQLEVVFAHTCTTHTYAAGEAFVDPGGHEEVARNPSDTQRAVAYALFLAVPDGEPPTTHVVPPDC